MASIGYGSTPEGGFQATVSGAPGFGSAGGGWGNYDWIAALARRSAENKLAKQKLELSAMQQARNAAKRAEMRGTPREQTDIDKLEAARSYMDRLESPLDRYSLAPGRSSNFRNLTAASMISGVGGGFPNPWVDLYGEAAGGPSSAAVQNAGENWRAQLQADFLKNYMNQGGGGNR